MKALSIHQPWAWKIAVGHKTIECRDWYNPHRGLVVIHATKTFDHGPQFSRTDGSNITGALIGYAYLKDIKMYESRAHLVDDEKYHYILLPVNVTWPRYGWIFTGAQLIDDPIPARGYPKLWTLPAALEERFKMQMKGTDR